ncbi:unnamed protein product [Cochlearia groenlandica]
MNFNGFVDPSSFPLRPLATQRRRRRRRHSTGLSDTDLVFAVRNTLASVQNGDTDNYTQLVGSMYLKEYSDFDSVAQLETVLRVLSVSVTWLDTFHHRDLLSSAILYVLCFRMRSILGVPRFQSQLTSLESILSHKLNPLMCLSFLNKLIVSESFIFDDLLESELSRALGGFERLDTFFPFDPCLLKSSNSFIAPNFVYWSMVKPIYDVDEDDDEDELCAEVIVNGDEDMSEEESCEDEEVDIDNEMCIFPPKHSFMQEERETLLKMPSRIRPSTSPPQI